MAPSSQCICSGCLNDCRALLTHAHDICPICARYSLNAQPCMACMQHPPVWQQLWHSAEYCPPLPAALHEWKHAKRSHFAALFRWLMRENPPRWLMDVHIDGILAMPLSRERRLWRGFNQCDELAEEIGQTFRLPVWHHDVVFRQHKVAQSSLNKKQRIENIQNAFEVKSADVVGKNILLVDDILTTGATITELARVLKNAGAVQIYVWVMARKK